MEEIQVKFYRMNKDVKIPVRAHETDACWDVYANRELIIPAGDRMTVPTGLKVAIPTGWELLIRPRSGLASASGIIVLNTPGTIDAGYRGHIKVILHNTDKESFLVKKDARIAQMALRPVYNMKIIEVESEELLGETPRGAGGFGSTGG
jgi:dUTP pyrophosphatase